MRRTGSREPEWVATWRSTSVPRIRLVYRQGEGIVFDEPTIVALHAATGDVHRDGRRSVVADRGDSGNVLAAAAATGRGDHGVRRHAAHARTRAAPGGRDPFPAPSRPRVHIVGGLAHRAPSGRGGRGQRRGPAGDARSRSRSRRRSGRAFRCTSRSATWWSTSGGPLGDGGGVDGRRGLGHTVLVGGYDVDAAIQEHIKHSTALPSGRRPPRR